MAGYIIADIEITDPNEYQRYAQQTQATIDKYGGKSCMRRLTRNYRGRLAGKAHRHHRVSERRAGQSLV